MTSHQSQTPLRLRKCRGTYDKGCMRRHPLHSQSGTHCRQLRPKRRHPSCTAHVGAGDCTQPRLNPSKQRLERSCEGREKVVRGSRATDEQRCGAQARDGTVIAWRGEGAMRAPPDELADVQRCAKSPLLMLHRLRLCPREPNGGV